MDTPLYMIMECDMNGLKKELDMVLDNSSKPKWFDGYSSLYSYVTLMGSRAYGTATEYSDYDFYGFCVPPLNVIFPYLDGEILDFGDQKQRFNQLQLQNHSSDRLGDVDVTVYNIVRYFQLVMGANPNMVDSLFVPDESIVFMDDIGKLVRDNRHLFLSDRIYHSYRGMAHHHMNRLKGSSRQGKRKDLVDTYGYDTKDAYHTIRCLLEARDFLFEGDCDIASHADIILEIRNGEWGLEYLKDEFEGLLEEIEGRYNNKESVLPYKPNQEHIRNILLTCIEVYHRVDLYLDLNFNGLGGIDIRHR